MYIVLDIGGTKTRMAVSRDGEHLEEPRIIPTPQDFEEAIEVYKREIADLSKDFTVKALCAGVAGTLNQDHSMVVAAPHLPGWAGKPLQQELESALGVPVYVANDTALVGLGEALHGAGVGGRIVAYVTVSTGVGAVRLVDGKIDQATYGFEVGHQFIDQGLTLEQLISGSAMELKYGQKPGTITDQEIWREYARYLAMGLNNIIVHWSPDTVVVGGSMLNTVGIPLDTTKEYLAEMLTMYPELPRIEHSQLGDIGGLHGALFYLKERFF